MLRKLSLSGLFTAALLYLASPVGFADTPPSSQSAQAMIQQTTEQVLQELRANQARLQAHPNQVQQLIRNQVLPHFDFQRMSRWVLGRYWRSASAAQKKAFVGQFEQLLINTYGNELLNYSGQSIHYEPPRANPANAEVTVRTVVGNPNGASAIPIDYRVYNDHGQWKVFDVSVDGVSLLTNYRESFSSEIQMNGMNGLLKLLRAHNQQFSS